MKIFSGIRPTGQIHIGNYLGAVKQWLELQHNNDCVFCVVDWHAITTPYEPSKLQENIKNMAATYLALGLDPEKCILFVQSQVKEHAELAWILNTIIPVAELERMTQYKEKSGQYKETPNMGLLNYPVLMAADILLYNTEIVPVGKDQKQHVELSRTIAKKFNKKFGNTFPVPKAQLAKGAKIMGLDNPKKKMSKSLGGKNCLFVFDKPVDIKQKIMAALTDTEKDIRYDPDRKPGISNLLTRYGLFSNKPVKKIEGEFQGKNYGQFKQSLAKVLIESLEPLRRKRTEIDSKQEYVNQILDNGAEKARVIARSTMEKVRKRAGLS